MFPAKPTEEGQDDWEKSSVKFHSGERGYNMFSGIRKTRNLMSLLHAECLFLHLMLAHEFRVRGPGYRLPF